MSVARGLGAAGLVNNYNIDDILKSAQTTSTQPSGFRRVLGAVAGGVGNIVAPGLGGTIGNLISGGTLNSTGLLGDSTKFLQRQMTMETRAFETASNVMKARHDAAMSAIRNLK